MPSTSPFTTTFPSQLPFVFTILRKEIKSCNKMNEICIHNKYIINDEGKKEKKKELKEIGL